VNFPRLLCVGGNAKRTEHSAKRKPLNCFLIGFLSLFFLLFALCSLLHAIL
jgi:hypothetical protein